MITTTKQILHTLLALLLMLCSHMITPPHTQSLTTALPITSKPIESTAENLAWQAWLMLPPEQKNLEKSRKVTPKSIFTLPFRECPPGHQLFENRCIPTLNIDANALLHQQLLELVVGDGNAPNTQYPNYDYDDEELVMYDVPQKFSGGLDVGQSGSSSSSSSSNYDDASQLPSQDEPLKFNIFQQKFPTDYESDMPASFGGSEPAQVAQVPHENHRTNTLLEGTEFMEAVKEFLQRNSNKTNNSNIIDNINNNTANSSNSTVDTNVNNFGDLQSDSSNVSANVVVSSDFATTAASTTTNKRPFFVSDIDAIALPAITTGSAAGITPEHQQKFSLFKDDSAIQLVTTVNSDRRNNDETMQADMAKLLKADSLIPLDIMPPAPKHMVTNQNGATTPATTTTIVDKVASNTRFSLSTSMDDEVTGMTEDDVDAEATTSMVNLSELLAVKEPILEAEPTKDEHTRSVTMRTSAEEDNTADLLAPQEEEFTTTLEPDATTNFQLDETTIIETHDPPAIVLQELHAAEAKTKTKTKAVAQHPREQALKQNVVVGANEEQSENQRFVLKKSKVEPVVLVVGTTETTTTTTTTTTTRATETPTASVTSTPLPTVSQSVKATPTMATKDDRFYYQHLGGGGVGVDVGVDVGNSDVAKDSNQHQQQQQTGIADDLKYVGSRSGTTTTATSEINIEQELRMINELVKGKQRQLATTNPTPTATRSTTTTVSSTAKTTTTTTTTTQAESGFTAETEETETTGAETETSASNNKETIEADVATTTAAAAQSSLTTVESSNDASSSNASKVATTATTTNAASTISNNSKTEPTATLWSKIMPMLGFGTPASSIQTEESTTSIAATTPSTTKTTTITTTTTTAAAKTTQSESTSSSSSISININRSNRNSKISRINSQSANSISPTSSHVTSSEPTTTTTPIINTTTETAATEDETTTTEISDTDTEVTDGGFEPFWWLPVGWRLDRNANDEEESLLLRFWSAFPGNQAKVKK